MGHEADKNPYRDIIDLPHPVSKKHPQMSLSDRAAQFAPFAALTGFDEEVDETAEQVRRRIRESEEGEAFFEDP